MLKRYFCMKKELFINRTEKSKRRKLETPCRNKIRVTPRKETQVAVEKYPYMIDLIRKKM